MVKITYFNKTGWIPSDNISMKKRKIVFVLFLMMGAFVFAQETDAGSGDESSSGNQKIIYTEKPIFTPPSWEADAVAMLMLPDALLMPEVATAATLTPPSSDAVAAGSV